MGREIARKERKGRTPHPPLVEGSRPRWCKARTKDGRPCHAAPLKGSDFCRYHDPRPEIKEGLRQDSSAGGRTSTAAAEWKSIEIKGQEDLRRFINEVLNLVASRKMLPKVSYALAPHLTNMIRLFEDQPCHPVDDVTSEVLEVIRDYPDAQAELLKRLRPKELEP